jgi:hypothetical protein
VVHRGGPQHQCSEGQRPPHVGPQEVVDPADPDVADRLLGPPEDRADHQQCQRQRTGQHAAEAEQQPQPPPSPPAARLGHVVGDVDGVDQRAERGRQRCEGQQGGDGQRVRAGVEDLLDGGDGVVRRVGEQLVEEGEDRVLDAQRVALADEAPELTEDRRDHQQRREQRQHGEEGALRGQSEQSVPVRLVDDLAREAEEPGDRVARRRAASLLSRGRGPQLGVPAAHDVARDERFCSACGRDATAHPAMVADAAAERCY